MLTLVSAANIVLASNPSPGSAHSIETPEFSDGFLIGGRPVDVARYTRGEQVLPGDYAVDVRINGHFLKVRDITFVDAPHRQGGADRVMACLPVDVLDALGLKRRHREALDAAGGGCPDLMVLVPGAMVSFDSRLLQLSITIPQAMQDRPVRGAVAASDRDAGISAGFIDYTAHHFQGRASRETSVGVHAGVNAGPWRLRHRAAFNHGHGGIEFNALSSVLQRDLPALKAQLWVGQGNTGGELFQSVRFNGVRIASDERMLPDSLRGYAPVVRGVAESNARLTILQGGRVIREMSVPPGPFVVDDLYPTHFGGHLDVVVTEADGRRQHSKVSFAAVSRALRAGTSHFSATLGELDERHWDVVPKRFLEGAYVRGLSNFFTVLGGAQVGPGYRAVLAGATLNTPVGALGADLTQSQARAKGQPAIHGNSIRLNYQHYLAATGTQLALTAQHNNSQGFRTLSDGVSGRAAGVPDGGRVRQRLQMNFSQRLGGRVTMSVGGGRASYWDGMHPLTDFQFDVSGVMGRANYSVSAFRYRVADGSADTRYNATLSIPVGRLTDAARFNAQVSRSAYGVREQVGVSSTFGAQRALSYNVTASRSPGVSMQSAFLDYQGGQLSANGGYHREAGNDTLSLGASGSAVLHAGGINVGPPLGESLALVHAPGAQGARIDAGRGLSIARNGYGLLPQLSAYQWNTVVLDPSALSLDVQLMQSSQRVAPTAGAIVRVPFEVRRERTLFIDARDVLGRPLQFAARVEDALGRTLGAVGQGGVIALRGVRDVGSLVVHQSGGDPCQLHYRLPATPDAHGLYWHEARCLSRVDPLAPAPIP